MTGVLDADLALHHRVSQFLFLEARLLDEQRWEEWDDLFTEDGTYWAPAAPGQPDPLDHVSLIYEDRLLRKIRIARYSNPNAYSLQPFPRSSHQITNIMIDRHDESRGTLTVGSRFSMVEFRRDVQRIYGGEYIHDLVEADGGYRIERKKATLVNCEGLHETLSIYF